MQHVPCRVHVAYIYMCMYINNQTRRAITMYAPVSERQTDDVGELFGAGDRTAAAALVFDGARDVTRHALLAVDAQNAVQRVDVSVVHYVGRRRVIGEPVQT